MTSTGPILFLVPARGGSKRVPGKNLREVGGIPLVGRAVRTGLGAAAALGGMAAGNRVVCSTDDDAVAATAEAWGGEVLRRPAGLATDTATSLDVALHALDALGVDFATLVLLQPTSPLVEAADVVAAVERHRAADGRGVTSVAPVHPGSWHHGTNEDGGLVAAVAVTGPDRLLAGAFYVVTPADLRASRRFVQPGITLGHELPAERAVDVDEEHELVAAEAILAARPVRPVPIGDLVAGAGPVVVIAEAGVNHNGDVDLALALVDAAVDAGADIVKFQTFDPGALAAAGAPSAEYQRRSGAAEDGQRAMLERLTLPAEAWPILAAHAAARGIAFLSTPFDAASAHLLNAMDVPAFKVGSGELTNTPFIEVVARMGRSMLISTGMSNMTEVADAVDAVRAAGDPPLALFHCVSSYPARPADANLRAIETLRRAFGVPVGWSDHTPGIEMALAAVAAGAALVEKHLTLDRRMPGPDHAASLEPAAFAEMVVGIRAVEVALGDGRKRPVAAEHDVATVARRSLHWARALAAGATITADDIVILRPGTGLRPRRLAEVVGRRVGRQVRQGALVTADDIEGDA